jgi:hypothetical protein
LTGIGIQRRVPPVYALQRIFFGGRPSAAVAVGQDKVIEDVGTSTGANAADLISRRLAKLPAKLLEPAFVNRADDEFTKLCNEQKLYHPLVDGRLQPLPGARLAHLLKALLGLVRTCCELLSNNTVKLHRADAGALAAFAGEAGIDLAWAANAKRLIELGDGLAVARPDSGDPG